MDEQCNDSLFDVPPGVDRDQVGRVMQETDPDSVVEEYLEEYRCWEADIKYLNAYRRWEAPVTCHVCGDDFMLQRAADWSDDGRVPQFYLRLLPRRA